MRLLLDTHTLLWFLADDPSLSQPAKRLIEDPDNERWISIASAWEMSIKINLGKLTLSKPIAVFLNEHLGSNSIRVLPISIEHAGAVSTLPRHHRDPFDRLIICQAMIGNLTIISADAAFDAHPVFRSW